MKSVLKNVIFRYTHDVISVSRFRFQMVECKHANYISIVHTICSFKLRELIKCKFPFLFVFLLHSPFLKTQMYFFFIYDAMSVYLLTNCLHSVP